MLGKKINRLFHNLPLENGACVHRQHFAGVYNIFLAPGTLSGTIRLSPLFLIFFFLCPGKVEEGPISFFLNGNFFYFGKNNNNRLGRVLYSKQHMAHEIRKMSAGREL